MSVFYDKLRRLIFAPRPYIVSLYVKIGTGRLYWQGRVMARSRPEAERLARDEALKTISIAKLSVKRDRSIKTKLNKRQ